MAKTKEEVMQEVENVLATMREGFAMHGGNIEFVDLDMDLGKVSVRLQGACVGCPMADMTLKAGVEEALREMVPEVKEVVQVA